jgi:hypothetical protein
MLSMAPQSLSRLQEIHPCLQWHPFTAHVIASAVGVHLLNNPLIVYLALALFANLNEKAFSAKRAESKFTIFLYLSQFYALRAGTPSKRVSSAGLLVNRNNNKGTLSAFSLKNFSVF